MQRDLNTQSQQKNMNTSGRKQLHDLPINALLRIDQQKQVDGVKKVNMASTMAAAMPALLQTECSLRTRSLGATTNSRGCGGAARTTIDMALLLFAEEQCQYHHEVKEQQLEHENDDDIVSTCSSLSSHEDDVHDHNCKHVVQVSCRRDFLHDRSSTDHRRSIFSKYWTVTGETPVPLKRSNTRSSLPRSTGMTELISSNNDKTQSPSTPITMSPRTRRSIFGGCNNLSSNDIVVPDLPSVKQQSVIMNHKVSSPGKSCLKKHLHLHQQQKSMKNKKNGTMITLSSRSNESDTSLETTLTSTSSATGRSNNSSVRFDAQIRVISFERSMEQDVNDSKDWIDHFAA
jgi:hypothetical protein